jgi:hypothetical protein
VARQRLVATTTTITITTITAIINHVALDDAPICPTPDTTSQ